MTDEADDADDRERAEAQALARALEDASQASELAKEAPPEDALATALFLRHHGAQAEIDPTRSEAILRELQHRDVKRKRAWPLFAALSAAAAVALSLVVLEQRASRPAATAPATNAAAARIPSASAQLLAAQAAYAKPDRPERAKFEREMRSYRAALFRSLEAAYPARLSALEPSVQRRP